MYTLQLLQAHNEERLFHELVGYFLRYQNTKSGLWCYQPKFLDKWRINRKNLKDDL